jgi:hypothetical protein
MFGRGGKEGAHHPPCPSTKRRRKREEGSVKQTKNPEKVVSGSGFLLKAYEVSCRVWVRRKTLHGAAVIHP